MEHTKISTDIEQNIKQFQQLFADSADIKMKEMRLGKGKRRRCFLAYIEVAVSNMLLETTALNRPCMALRLVKIILKALPAVKSLLVL